MPRIVWRVVWGRSEVIATFAPTRAFVSVDLPVLGRPTKQAKPERCSVTARFSPTRVRMDDVGEEEHVGGDPVCWLNRVCPGCGALRDDEPPAPCPRCGSTESPP
jgi:ribosomal protein S27AE